MPNRSSAVSRTASRWAFQVSASLGATLIAAFVVQALPRSGPAAPDPVPELTSGGKFAARVAAARAYDGLDTMPLPRLDAPREAQAVVIPAAFQGVFQGATTDPAGFGTAPRPLLLDGPALRDRPKLPHPSRAPVRADAGRSGVPAAPSIAASPAETIAVASPDDGLLQRVASTTRQVWSSTAATTRDAWSATASAGSSLVSRVVP